MTITDPATGEETEEQVFVGTLGASSFPYAEVFAKQELHHWVAGHVPEVADGRQQTCFEFPSFIPAASVSPPEVG